VAAPVRGRPRGLQVGGLTPFTSIDFPGRLCAVVFVQGCPWRCAYCHNPHLQRRGVAAGPGWPGVLSWLRTRVGLLDAVVFSGGEPTLDPALPEAAAAVRALGFEIGLHSAGIYPQRLQAMLTQVDWVGLDIKAPLRDCARQARITGVPDGAQPVRRSLGALVRQHRASGLAFECRTTVHPALLDEPALLLLADELSHAGVANWVLQPCRVQGSTGALPPVPGGYPAPALLHQLRQRLPGTVVRDG
jgi:anaerobic ribonucleoside-triphosphate reductase activating protein